MNGSSKIVLAAALTGLSLITGVAAGSFASGARAVEAEGPVSVTSASRIDAAFATLPAAALSGSKGDLYGASCIGRDWPNIEPACLSVAGGRPRGAVRTVTIGYQDSDASSVLVRMPAPQIASR